jgi:hypothetical protein
VKIKSNILGVTLVLSIGIILTSAGSAFSVLGATPNATAGNMSNASNTTSKVLTNASKVVGGGLKGLGAMMSSPNNTKAASKVLTNISQAVGGGLKGLGNLLSPGKK